MTTVINTPNLQTIPAQQPQILQHPQVMQPPQIIQQQPQVIHTPIQQGCCGPMPKIIPDNLRPAVFRVGICALVNGLISTIFGIVGFFTTSVRIQGHHYTYYYSNVLAYIAPDIWCGIFINSCYSFSIMSFILSLFHIGLSFGFIFHYPSHFTVWFNIVSLILALCGSAFSLTHLIILSRNLYCRSNDSKMVAVQYNGSNQVVTFGQQAIVYPTSQPVYLQAAPGGHYTTAMNPNSVAPTSIQQVAPPQYGNLPQTKISN
ncbi:uncharacterized protein TRIADDRAFT_61178 [Trichoplax adhaerens]|uniref:Uncharacterized protein n=1 Tax=Trichoplax adhaerens TaxID=10228 RepID=B3SA90_TRIAD|nr:predicted protein [Trichoplax adhaerens]EDV20397.1 predicted protein [Trichoplax adhaerens]|eukprot:XP_002117091.1 predicted protein [Trichoplax adhaerens]